MGKISILTNQQKKIIYQVAQDPFLRKIFYFTGGTALSEFYLQHRLSNDLDFFTENKFESEIIFGKVSKWAKELKFEIKSSRFIEVVYRFEIFWPESNNTFWLDFAYYPYPRLEKGKNFEGLEIDSLKDIAVNKLLSISQRNDIKDFVDLYFILKENHFNIWELIYGVRRKFKQDIDILLLAEDLLKIEDFDYLPRMIKNLSLSEVKNYFRKLAISLGKKVIE